MDLIYVGRVVLCSAVTILGSIPNLKNRKKVKSTLGAATVSMPATTKTCMC